MVSLSSSTAAMAFPIAWSDVTEEIVIGAVDDDEATVTAEGEAGVGDEAIVTGEPPGDDDDIVDVVDYVIVHEVVLLGLEVVRLITCR